MPISNLISNDHFEQYVKQKTIDAGIIKESDFLYRHINWRSLIEERRQDYQSINHNGQIYWMRK